ncbi:MAG: class I SAM-dependent methyltransferase [Anaerolineae bacterium]|nr:class I SAM-dependent methyltransferase [Anaerolineae bacterium]
MAEQKTGPSLPPDLYDEDYFLSSCEGYTEWLATEGEHLSRRLASAFTIASIEPGMRVLDIGCGRGEIVRHCARLGADALGIDYAPVAAQMTYNLISAEKHVDVLPGKMRVSRADAKHLPFGRNTFDRVLMFDVVEHLYPWELHQALLETRRVLKQDGQLIIHTAPNRWYDQYAYPIVRLIRTLMGQGKDYPQNPRQFGVAVNEHVHVNEQSVFSIGETLEQAGFKSRAWLDSPPQNRQEGPIFAALRVVAFEWIPFSWFFEREVFAVAWKQGQERRTE